MQLGEIDPSNLIYQYLRLAPSGWLYMEQVEYNRIFEQYILPGFDAQTGVVHVGELTKNLGTLGQILASDSFDTMVHHRLLTTLLTPAFGKLYAKSHRRPDISQWNRHRLRAGTRPARHRQISGNAG